MAIHDKAAEMTTLLLIGAVCTVPQVQAFLYRVY